MEITSTGECKKPAAPLGTAGLKSLRATLDASEYDQNNDDEEDEAETATAIIAGAVEWPATKAAEAAQQGNDQNDDENSAETHGVFLCQLALLQQVRSSAC